LAPYRLADQSADPLETFGPRDDRHQVFDYRPELADPKKLIEASSGVDVLVHEVASGPPISSRNRNLPET